MFKRKKCKIVTAFCRVSACGHRTRTEQFERPMSYTDAFEKVSNFYTDKRKFGASSENFKNSKPTLPSFSKKLNNILRLGKIIASIADFPNRVVIALAHMIDYLSAFGMADVFFVTETQFSLARFATRAHMLLAANTLVNLEVYNRNETDYGARGSLMWVLDRTKTRFGARLLRSWVGRPLVDKQYAFFVLLGCD